MKRFLLSVLAFTLLIAAISPVATAALADEQNEDYSYNGTGYVDIAYAGYGFVWNDKWLTENSQSFKPDLAKACAALSALAYNQYDITQALTAPQHNANSSGAAGMGFTIVDSGHSYDERTFMDNDHVAYRIAKKAYIQDGQEYLLYCVPIRGTMEEEWFSDFANLGRNNGGYHHGFYLAAQELMQELRTIIERDGRSTSQRCILLTGHSRGAAVSNLVSAWLIEEGLASSSHLFSYNIACPNVSKSVHSYPCIFNIINKGDVVPEMPLEAWGYRRNGIDKNFATGNAGFVELMSILLPEEKDYFNPLAQLAFYCLSYMFCESGNMSAADVALYTAKRNALLQEANLNLLIGRLDSTSSYFRTLVLDEIEYLGQTLDMVAHFWDSIKDIASDEHPLSRLGNELRNRLEQFWEAGISTLDDVTGASNMVRTAKAQAETINDLTCAIMQLYADTNGDLSAIGDAHSQDTYYSRTCTRYLGYRGYYGSARTGIDLSSCADGPITTIGACCFQNCENLTNVILPPTLCYVGYSAFSSSGISGSLDFAEGLLSVGPMAFYECPGLTAIHLPHTVQWIGSSAFAYCPNVTEVTIPVEVPAAGAFTVPNVNTIHYLRGSTGVMPDRRGYNGSSLPGLDVSCTLENSCIESLTTIDFEEGIVHIGNEAYQASVHGYTVAGVLANVTLPSTLESIGSNTFWNQGMLKEISLPDSLQRLGTDCFQSTGLESIVIPGAIEEIPEYCFYGCSQLQSVEFPEGLKAIGAYAFYDCSALEALLLPHTIETLAEHAFEGTAALKELSIPIELCDSSLTVPFYGGGPIETIHYLVGSTGIMPDKTECTGLEQSMGSSLRKVDFEEGIMHIGDYAFALWGPNGVGSAAGTLEKVTLPSTLKSIGTSAFHGRAAISQLTLPEGLETLGDYAFKWNGLTQIDIPSSVTEIGYECFVPDERKLALIQFHGDAPVFNGDSVFRNAIAELVWPQNGTGWEAAIEALDTATLFCHSDAEPVLTVPGTIRVLEESALEDIGVSIIVLSPGVEAIGQDAFRNDGRVMLIRVPATVTQLDENAFRGLMRVFIAAPESSPAAEYVNNHSQTSNLYLIVTPD